MHVVEKLAIETSKHHKSATDENSWVATPGLWHRVSNLNLRPFFQINIEAVQVVYVVVVPSAQDVEFVLINCCCMAPTSAWDMAYAASEIEFNTLN